MKAGTKLTIFPLKSTVLALSLVISCALALAMPTASTFASVKTSEGFPTKSQIREFMDSYTLNTDSVEQIERAMLDLPEIPMNPDAKKGFIKSFQNFVENGNLKTGCQLTPVLDSIPAIPDDADWPRV